MAHDDQAHAANTVVRSRTGSTAWLILWRAISKGYKKGNSFRSLEDLLADPQGSPQLFPFHPAGRWQRINSDHARWGGEQWLPSEDRVRCRWGPLGRDRRGEAMTGLVSATIAGSRVNVGDVDSIDAQVLQIFDLVREAVGRATEVFLDADRAAARTVIERDQLIDRLHDRIERAVVAELALPGGLEPGRQAWLLLVFRILPELERSGDLSEHIASHVAQGLAKWLTPRARHLVQQMGTLGAEMWKLAADAYAHRDPASARLLRLRDDEIDDLHVNLTAELAASGIAVPVAIEMALVARYFERLGDHAVNVTRRLQQFADRR